MDFANSINTSRRKRSLKFISCRDGPEMYGSKAGIKAQNATLLQKYSANRKRQGGYSTSVALHVSLYQKTIVTIYATDVG